MVSKAQRKATQKYENANYDKIMVRLKKGTRERIAEYSKSMNGYISQAVYKQLQEDDERKEAAAGRQEAAENYDAIPPELESNLPFDI